MRRDNVLRGSAACGGLRRHRHPPTRPYRRLKCLPLRGGEHPDRRRRDHGDAGRQLTPPGGNEKDRQASIQKFKHLSFPADMVVYDGHDDTSITYAKLMQGNADLR